MNRADLQRLAKLRIREAKVLFDNKFYEGAYYLLGYAVECAFKACIAKQIRRHDFPDRKMVNDIYTHDLTKLLNVSGLAEEHRKECKSNPDFEANWSIVKDWSEQSRYSTGVAMIQARDFQTAVLGRRNGVLKWLQKYW